MSFVADILGAGMSASATRSAARTQAEATQKGVDEQRRQFDLTRGDFAPYREAGVNALAQLQAQMGQPVTSAEVMSDPGYQFGMQQGQQALDRKFSAAGGRVSGAAMKAAARYGTDYASTGYGAAYQRRQDALNRLAALAGVGQTATGASAAAGSNAANNISNMLTAQGNAAAGAKLAQGSMWGNTVNSLAAQYGRSNPSSANTFGNFNSWGFGSGLGYGNQDLGMFL